MPWWNQIWAGRRHLSYYLISHLEAAQLALWEDLDCKSFDALSVSRRGENSEAHAVKAPQDRLGDPRDTDFALFSHTVESHGLLCTRLLSICEELLDPRLGRAQPMSPAGSDEALLALLREGSELDSDEEQASLGLSSWPNDQRSFLRRASTSFLLRAMEASASPELAHDSSLQRLFTIFVDKVRPLQVWRDDGGARGDQQEEVLQFSQRDIYPPVLKSAEVRLMVAIAAQHEAEMYKTDTTQAFLSGDVEEDLCLRAPDWWPELVPEGHCVSSSNRISTGHGRLHGISVSLDGCSRTDIRLSTARRLCLCNGTGMTSSSTCFLWTICLLSPIWEL